MTDAMPAGTLRAPSQLRLALATARMEFLAYRRSPAAVAFALLLPTVLYLVAVNIWYPVEGRALAVPDTLVMSVLAVGLFTVGIVLTEARQSGTLKTYLASPLSARAYLLGQLLDRLFIISVGNAVMVVVAAIGFDLAFTGSVPLAVLAAVLTTATALTFGFALSSRFGSVESAGGACSGIFFLSLLASGLWLERGDLPAVIGHVVDVLPFRPMVELSRHAWLGDATMPLGRSLLTVVAWLLAFTIVSVMTFRWTADDR